MVLICKFLKSLFLLETCLLLLVFKKNLKKPKNKTKWKYYYYFDIYFYKNKTKKKIFLDEIWL